MPAGHGGWRSSLVLLPRCLWSRSRFDGPLWGRWPRIGWYLWVSDPGSAGMGHRCSSSGVGRHDDIPCRLSQVSLLFYCNIFSKYVYLCCVCEMGAYEHIHVHVDEILVWNWVSPGWLFPWCRIHASVYLVIIGSSSGLSPVRRQAIAWTNVAYLSIGPLGTSFSETRIWILSIPYRICIRWCRLSWRPFCLGLYVLRQPLMIELHISYAAEHWIPKPMFHCSTTVVSTQETDTDRCKDAFPIMDCLYCYCAYIMIYVSPLVHLRSINYYYYYYYYGTGSYC